MTTLGELYDALDWSAVSAEHERYYSGHTDAQAIDPDFQKRWRCAIIEEALWSEDESRLNASRMLLQKLGIWPQVLRLMATVSETPSSGESPSPVPG